MNLNGIKLWKWVGISIIKKKRADLYHGLEDSVKKNDLENSGRVVILPASYSCSDRWYNKKYLNAMSIVHTKGKPTLFITMTMDVNCDEVKRQLNDGESPYDRPDIVCRVYEQKRSSCSNA